MIPQKASFLAHVYISNEYRMKRIREITLEEIFSEVCSIFNVDEDFVRSMDRHTKPLMCRYIYSYVAYGYRKWNLKEIAMVMGSFDHTMVIHIRRRIKEMIDSNDTVFFKYWDEYKEKSIILNLTCQ